MKKVFLLIVCLPIILAACSAKAVETDAPRNTEQAVVTDAPKPTPMPTPELTQKPTPELTQKPTQKPTPEPTPLSADALLDEDLRESQGEIYRCSSQVSTYDGLIRTIIRVEVVPDGTGVLRLVTKTWNFTDADNEVIIEEDPKQNLSKEQIDGLLRFIEEKDFWNLDEYLANYNPTNPPTYLDIDAVKNSEFHCVYRGLSPAEAYADIYDLFEYFIELCGDKEYDLQ